MRVRRRTVWFMTLLSLVAVISVYYLVDPAKQFNGLTIFTDDTLQQTAITGVTDQEATSKQDATQEVLSPSHLFEEMRMQVNDERSQLREQLTQKIASEEYTAEEKNEAFNEIDGLIKQESAEAMLEMLIKSLGYNDAFVRAEGEKVSVTVMAEELSKSQANEIIYLVKTEWEGANDVQVKFSANNY
ncbi:MULTISPECIES: SpoIIIAH-like family protein [Lysinibacillus]|uniref:Stage III sporulation protein AH n=2 Tax=Lysinibacillus TaxID=400634 RepID=A0A2S5CYR4_LYSSH|nr:MULTISPECIES: SpoIIIAH-like family protein [Lysinibacillus]AHN22365.1 stage III sporulation protein AH [Lysinibacillus varians]OEC00575.1 stage III sporulation protein AH [Lysinibacillus sphaericus]POZ55888.1 Stage III sporulation protein AH [Lysinibacillus sphaericus]TKI65025.1 SpoIIIAH-like family protein [Lysinibacillus varians]